MLNYIWPVALAVLSNTFYQICAKSVPGNMNPLASLTITYVVGAVVSGVLYIVLNHMGPADSHVGLLAELTKTNWAPFLLGVVIVGLEVGFIYAYKVGWPVSTVQIVAASALAVILIFVGRLLYSEPITWNKVIGIIVCLGGLGLVNMK